MIPEYVKNRQIKYAGRYSYDDFGLYIGMETDTETGREPARPRIIRETIPFMNGSYDFSRVGGKTVYDDQTLRYTFIIHGRDMTVVQDKAAALDEWLSGTETELYDTAYPGWKFVGVSYMGMSAVEYYSSNRTLGKVSVEFTSSPYLRSTTGKLIDCTDFTPNDDPTLYICDVYADQQAGARPYCYFPRMAQTTFSSITGETTAGDYYVQTTITGATTRHWLGAQSSYNGYTFEITGYNNSSAIGNDSNYAYVRGISATAQVRVTATLNGQAVPGSTILSMLNDLTWLKSVGTAKNWQRDRIPSLDNMRIVSEGDPVLTIDGSAADISGFALPQHTLISLANAKSEPCKLQYCTIKERR